MSTTAEDVTATLSSEESNLENVDQIAELLLGDDEPEIEDENSEETPAQSLTQEEGEISNEEQEAAEGDDDEVEEEDTTLEVVADEDLTWATALGVNEDQLSFDEDGDIAGINVKVNGESETIDMSTLIAGFQNNKANTVKSQSHAEAVKEFEVQKEQTEQLYASKLESVDALTKHFENQLIAEFDNINWDQLRVEDPAEYAAARHDYATKAGELQKVMGAIQADKESQNNEQLQAQQANQQAYMKNQYDIMLQNNPEWSDETIRNAAREGYQTFVKDQYGFADEHWDMVTDARLIELIKDAKKYHDGAAVAAKKTQKPVPKFQKSRGVVQKTGASKLEKLTSAAESATGSRKRDLQASAVAELLAGG